LVKEGVSDTTFSLSGLQQNLTYHMYINGYRNHEVITTDANGSVTFSLDTSTPTYVMIQTQPSTIFVSLSDISGDGLRCAQDYDFNPMTLMEEPTGIFFGDWDADTNTCTLTQDVTETVQIDDSNITLDCIKNPLAEDDDSDSNGNDDVERFKITGPGFGNGVFMFSGTGNTVKNCEISGFTIGIFNLNFGPTSGGHTIMGNDVHDMTGIGVLLLESNVKSFITANHIHDMNGIGVFLINSNNHVVDYNIIENIEPDPTPPFLNSNGIFLLFSGNVKLEKNEISNVQFFATPNGGKFNGEGITIFGSSDPEIINNTVSGSFVGIHIHSNSQNMTLTGNTLLNNTFNLILEISIAVEGGNTVTNRFLSFNIDATNTVDGKPILYLKNEVGTVIDNSSNAGMVYCIQCDDVTIKDLTVSNNGTGIGLIATTNSVVKKITAIDNHFGIQLINSDSNIVKENHIVKIDPRPKADQGFEIREYSGIFLANSSDNDIIQNTITMAHIFAFGVWLLNPVDGSLTSTDNRIDSNLIQNDGFVGIVLSILTNENKVRCNRIMGPEFQIQVADSSDNKILGNVMSDGGGIQVTTFGSFPNERNVFRNNVVINGTKNFGFGFGFDGSLRVPGMEAGFRIAAQTTIDRPTDTILEHNIVTRMKGDGILLIDADSTQVFKNDIFQNDGFSDPSNLPPSQLPNEGYQANSDLPIVLSFGGVGNFWGREDPPCFVPGPGLSPAVDSNAADVNDPNAVCDPFFIPCVDFTYINIDVKPGRWPNFVSDDDEIKVAILSTESFDATTEVNPKTAILVGDGIKTGDDDDSSSDVESKTKDVNGDGLPDLVLAFNLEDDSSGAKNKAIVFLKVKTFDGTQLLGVDILKFKDDDDDSSDD